MKKIFCSIVVLAVLLSSTIFGAEVYQQTGNPEEEQKIKAEISQKINSVQSVLESKNTVDGKDGIFSTVFFGNYVQDEYSTEKKPIEWYVLEKRVDKAILLSKYVLDQTKYNTLKNASSWNTTSLKEWLNKDFYNSAFSSVEKKVIVSNPYRNVGFVTIPSLADMTTYFKNGDDYLDNPQATKMVNQKYRQTEGYTYEFWLYDDTSISWPNVMSDKNGSTKTASAKDTYGIRPMIVVDFVPNAATNNAQQTNNTGAAQTPNITQADNASNDISAPLYCQENKQEHFNHTYYDDDDNKKTVQVTVRIPIYSSTNVNKATLINNLMQTTGYGIVSQYVKDYIEDGMLKGSVSVVYDDIKSEDDYKYYVRFTVNANTTLCTLWFDIASAQCYAE